MNGSEHRGRRRPLLTARLKRPAASYPFTDLDLAIKQLILQGLRSAWQRTLVQVAEDGGDLGAETEPAITSRLQITLNAILGEVGHPSGFSGSIFQDVVRGAEISNYSNEKLEKRPDLTFRLISVEPGLDRSLYALFAECKIVGPSHSIAAYCGSGIHRFIVGDYAWAMPCGMMLAYSHTGFTVTHTLVPYLQRAVPESETRLVHHIPRLSPDLSGNPPVYESRHNRPWSYPDQGDRPGDISLLHLWLPLAPGSRV